MWQDHRKTTGQGKDKLNMIRESERPLQKDQGLEKEVKMAKRNLEKH